MPRPPLRSFSTPRPLAARAAARAIPSAPASSGRRRARRCIAAARAWSPSNASSAFEEARMLSFHPLEVTAVDRIAEDATAVTLAIPDELRERFRHHAGQYVTVRRSIDGREERRTYSIVTPPGGSTLKLGVRRQTGGRMSHEIAGRLRPGDKLEVGAPLGRFRTSIDPARARAYVAFAAGSGITPVLSLATHILAREPHSRFTLIYGNRSSARAMFLEDTLALKNRYLGRFA